MAAHKSWYPEPMVSENGGVVKIINPGALHDLKQRRKLGSEIRFGTTNAMLADKMMKNCVFASQILRHAFGELMYGASRALVIWNISSRPGMDEFNLILAGEDTSGDPISQLKMYLILLEQKYHVGFWASNKNCSVIKILSTAEIKFTKLHKKLFKLAKKLKEETLLLNSALDVLLTSWQDAINLRQGLVASPALSSVDLDAVEQVPFEEPPEVDVSVGCAQGVCRRIRKFFRTGSKDKEDKQEPPSSEPMPDCSYTNINNNNYAERDASLSSNAEVYMCFRDPSLSLYPSPTEPRPHCSYSNNLDAIDTRAQLASFEAYMSYLREELRSLVPSPTDPKNNYSTIVRRALRDASRCSVSSPAEPQPSCSYTYNNDDNNNNSNNNTDRQANLPMHLRETEIPANVSEGYVRGARRRIQNIFKTGNRGLQSRQEPMALTTVTTSGENNPRRLLRQQNIYMPEPCQEMLSPSSEPQAHCSYTNNSTYNKIGRQGNLSNSEEYVNLREASLSPFSPSAPAEPQPHCSYAKNHNNSNNRNSKVRDDVGPRYSRLNFQNDTIPLAEGVDYTCMADYVNCRNVSDAVEQPHWTHVINTLNEMERIRKQTLKISSSTSTLYQSMNEEHVPGGPRLNNNNNNDRSKSVDSLIAGDKNTSLASLSREDLLYMEEQANNVKKRIDELNAALLNECRNDKVVSGQPYENNDDCEPKQQQLQSSSHQGPGENDSDSGSDDAGIEQVSEDNEVERQISAITSYILPLEHFDDDSSNRKVSTENDDMDDEESLELANNGNHNMEIGMKSSNVPTEDQNSGTFFESLKGNPGECHDPAGQHHMESVADKIVEPNEDTRTGQAIEETMEPNNDTETELTVEETMEPNTDTKTELPVEKITQPNNDTETVLEVEGIMVPNSDAKTKFAVEEIVVRNDDARTKLTVEEIVVQNNDIKTKLSIEEFVVPDTKGSESATSKITQSQVSNNPSTQSATEEITEPNHDNINTESATEGIPEPKTPALKYSNAGTVLITEEILEPSQLNDNDNGVEPAELEIVELHSSYVKFNNGKKFENSNIEEIVKSDSDAGENYHPSSLPTLDISQCNDNVYDNMIIHEGGGHVASPEDIHENDSDAGIDQNDQDLESVCLTLDLGFEDVSDDEMMEPEPSHEVLSFPNDENYSDDIRKSEDISTNSGHICGITSVNSGDAPAASHVDGSNIEDSINGGSETTCPTPALGTDDAIDVHRLTLRVESETRKSPEQSEDCELEPLKLYAKTLETMLAEISLEVRRLSLRSVPLPAPLFAIMASDRYKAQNIDQAISCITKASKDYTDPELSAGLTIDNKMYLTNHFSKMVGNMRHCANNMTQLMNRMNTERGHFKQILKYFSNIENGTPVRTEVNSAPAIVVNQVVPEPSAVVESQAEPGGSKSTPFVKKRGERKTRF